VGASVAKAYIYIQATLGRYTEDAIRMSTARVIDSHSADLCSVILTGLSIWNLVEIQVEIIAACGPTLRPILTHILPTEGIRSLLGSMRAQKTSRRAEGLPSFVKIGTSRDANIDGDESAQKLADTESHELRFLTESDHKV
jgi:hypothetical protein